MTVLFERISEPEDVPEPVPPIDDDPTPESMPFIPCEPLPDAGWIPDDV